MLTFLSRPIPKDQRENFKIQFDPKSNQLDYRQIFRENQSIVTSVENYLQQDSKAWRIQKDDYNNNNNYEVFMKIE